MLRVLPSKSIQDIAAEWDALAALRYEQITSGRDISYSKILSPNLLALADQFSPRNLLDAGCGTGVLTALLSKVADQVTGVDLSPVSASIAQKAAPNARIVQSSIEEFSKTRKADFDFIVANMVLMDAINLDTFLLACRRLISARGHLAFSITHPCFWPTYYGYGNAPWFNYDSELIVESPFRITSDPIGELPSTHVHRPLSRYVSSLRNSGFVVLELLEPLPPADAPAAYLASWTLPRYIIGLCKAA